ncbi:hypothetical protein [Vibrio anguillarum]|uniref:hypothetical protein n=1 Tax=Vibrio anguillarum TaxID=55601 RepID=UPI000210F50B|nr:hypothetical protein [Vibrio anguillarum]AEH35287.1 hypothetical protein VAA_00230 [Vibrio anguillarum 775]AGU59915.1 hypothetical protein N175_19010 [Vibrio anguillarum M3]
MDFIWLVLAFGAAAIFYYFVSYSKPQDDDWHKLPTLENYLIKHPECKTADPESAS